MNNNLANEIRSKTDIVDIIGERIPLVSRGKNFFCVCPFHDDTNPSMCVSREKQIYTCFSCHASGNVITFLMNYEHMDFKETLKYLGERVNIDVSGLKVNRKTTKYDKLYDAYNLSLKYFQNNLNSNAGVIAKKYLSERKIDDKLIKEFEIGLSLDKKDDLTNLLVKKDYDLVTLNKIGLSSDKNDVYIDRIMFPLYDTMGRVVAFSGRIYKDVDQNKYLNTKETEIFKKGENLYHYHIAREEVRNKKEIIIMEGFMDVIRASSIGVKNTVALMGTALTKEQTELIKRLSNNIILCLDGDEPGVHATISIGEHLLKEGIEVKVISLPNKDDPDTYILNNGKDKFIRLIENALNFNDYKMNILKSKSNLNTDEGKANYINAVLKETAKLDDPIRVEVVLKRLAKEFDIGYNTLELRLKGYKDETKPIIKQEERVVIPKKVTKRKDKYIKAVEQIIFFMLNNDWVVTQVDKEKLIFPNEISRVLSSEIIYYYKKNGFINVPDFYTYIQDKEELYNFLSEIISQDYLETTEKDELILYFNVLKEYNKKQEIKRLTSKMKEEIDPLEQAKIAEKIRNLRIGDN